MNAYEKARHDFIHQLGGKFQFILSFEKDEMFVIVTTPEASRFQNEHHEFMLEALKFSYEIHHDKMGEGRRFLFQIEHVDGRHFRSAFLGEVKFPNRGLK